MRGTSGNTTRLSRGVGLGRTERSTPSGCDRRLPEVDDGDNDSVLHRHVDPVVNFALGAGSEYAVPFEDANGPARLLGNLLSFAFGETNQGPLERVQVACGRRWKAHGGAVHPEPEDPGREVTL